MRIAFIMIFPVLLILLNAMPAYAFSLSGSIVKKDSKKPLSDISVGIEELKIVTVSNKNGEFRFDKIIPGKYTLKISNPLFEEKSISIKLKRNFYIEIELGKALYSIEEVQYYYKTGDRFGEQYITGKDIKEMPLRGVGDSLHLLQTLPGVGSGSAWATVPLIRGGNPLYDKYYIDEIPVDYPYHYLAAVVPIISSINEEVIERASVIKGISPMYYDDNLGNIIQVKTKNPNETGIHSKILLDPIFPILPTISVSAIPDKNLSIIGAVRRSYVDTIIELKDLDFYIQDHFIKLQYNLFSRHRFYLIAFGSDDYCSFGNFKTRSMFNVEGLKWKFLINKMLFLKTVFSRYRLEHHLEHNDIYEDMAGVFIRFSPRQYRLYQMLSAVFNNYYIKSGYEYLVHKSGVEANVTLNDIPDINIIENYTDLLKIKYPIEGNSFSFFTEAGADFNQLWVNTGFRYKRYGPLSNSSLSYRILYGYHLDAKTALYSGGGVYHAHPDMYYYLGNTNPSFKDSRAYNYILGMKLKISTNLSGQLELYYSKYSDLTVATLNIVNDNEYKMITQINPFSNEEKGKSKGFEIFLKGRSQNYQGWFSYAYSISERSSSRFNLNDYYSDYDQTHIFRLVIKGKIDNFVPSFIYHYYSTLPYTPITGSNEISSDYEPVYGKVNSKRYTAHQRIDSKLTYITKDNYKFYIEIWNLFYFQKNRVYQRFHNNMPHGDRNPDIISEFSNDYAPVFIWMGMELCI